MKTTLAFVAVLIAFGAVIVCPERVRQSRTALAIGSDLEETGAFTTVGTIWMIDDSWPQ